MRQESILKDLQALLLQERAALLRADFAALEALIEPKQALLTHLADMAAPATALERLRHEALRNDALLQAVTAGLAAVGARLRAYRDGVQTSCYSADGTHSPITRQATTLTQKL